MNISRNSTYYPVFSTLTDVEAIALKALVSKLSSIIKCEWCSYNVRCATCKYRAECCSILNFEQIFEEIEDGITK